MHHAAGVGQERSRRGSASADFGFFMLEASGMQFIMITFKSS